MSDRFILKVTLHLISLHLNFLFKIKYISLIILPDFSYWKKKESGRHPVEPNRASTLLLVAKALE